jgi:hypothetical protein
MRREKAVTITDTGRDQGKTFLIREMPASQAEKWAARAFLALAKSGVQLPEGIERAGFAGIATVGAMALAGVTFHEAEPLMDEMFRCVSFSPAGGQYQGRPLIEDDIEEVATRLKLRIEVMELHTGFSLAGALSRFAPAADPI